MSEFVVRDAGTITDQVDVVDVERWASAALGQAWVRAPMSEREPEHQLCTEVIELATSRPSHRGLAAVEAFRRVAAPGDQAALADAAATLTRSLLRPDWADVPPFRPVQAWRAVDVWDSERILFVEFETPGPDAYRHTLMAQITEPGGSRVATLGVGQPGAAQEWAAMRSPSDVPMPLSSPPVEEVLSDLADALRYTDMFWPRHDDEDFVEARMLAWARCREYLTGWPEPAERPAAERRELIEAFLAGADRPGAADVKVVESLIEVFCDYGEGHISNGPLAWSPGWVALFLADWLPRKSFLDAAAFALRRRGVEPQWIEPVTAAVDTYLPEFTAAVDDESSWGPAKQIAAELAARGVDVTDKDAVNQVISELNAIRLAEQFGEE